MKSREKMLIQFSDGKILDVPYLEPFGFFISNDWIGFYSSLHGRPVAIFKVKPKF